MNIIFTLDGHENDVPTVSGLKTTLLTESNATELCCQAKSVTNRLWRLL